MAKIYDESSARTVLRGLSTVLRWRSYDRRIENQIRSAEYYEISGCANLLAKDVGESYRTRADIQLVLGCREVRHHESNLPRVFEELQRRILPA